jgi:hypothetical protein
MAVAVSMYTHDVFDAVTGNYLGELDLVRIPVMWATDYGDVGQSRSEATLVVSYISHVAHMSQEKANR